MGNRNQIRARWASRKLKSRNAVLALLEMAYVSMDDDDPPLYWGGWERLAIAIGYDLPPEPDPEAVAAGDPDALDAAARRKTAMNAAVAATRALTAAQIIRLRRGHSPGRNNVWSIHLDLAQPVDNGASDSAHSPEGYGSEQSRGLQSHSPVNHGSTVPRVAGLEEEEGFSKRTDEEDMHPSSESSPSAREADEPKPDHVDWSKPHEFLDDQWGSCRGCNLPASHPIHRSAS